VKKRIIFALNKCTETNNCAYNYFKLQTNKEMNKMKIKWKEDKVNVIALLKTGLTMAEVGKMYGVKKAAIDRGLREYCPEIDRSELGVHIRVKKDKENKRLSNIEKYGRETGHPQNELERRVARWFSYKARNVKTDDRYKKYEFDITLNDLLNNCEIPLICQYLEIPLNWFNKKMAFDSPTIDRIDNTKGYVKGNVIICSLQANSIKRGDDLEELKNRKKVKDKELLNTLIKNLTTISCTSTVI
jgi:hypothetical protein